MRTLLLIATTCSFLTTHAQDTDWALFPLTQRSILMDRPDGQRMQADLFLMDSIRPVGDDTVLYFRRDFIHRSVGDCYDAVRDGLYLYQDRPFAMDSAVLRNDTVFLHPPINATPYYLLPHAAIGQSWPVVTTVPGNEYDTIIITCTGIAEETFLGITDSVKTFTMTANGTSPGQTPVDAFPIKLSKHHGLVASIPFPLFLYHPASTDFRALELIGLERNGEVHGYQQPTFTDYFPYSPGDILLWERHEDPWELTQPETWAYSRDSITDVTSTGDSVVYLYDRMHQDELGVITAQPGLRTAYLRSTHGALLDAPPNGFCISEAELDLWATGLPTVWNPGPLDLAIDDVTGDTITTYAFSSFATVLDTVECQYGETFDLGYSFTFDTQAGPLQWCTDNFGTYCTTLIGWRIGGRQNGNIALSVDEQQALANSSVLFPNPATDRIFLRSITAGRNCRYELFDVHGDRVRTGTFTDQGLAVDDLPHGLYLLRVDTDAGMRSARFVKQ